MANDPRIPPGGRSRGSGTVGGQGGSGAQPLARPGESRGPARHPGDFFTDGFTPASGSRGLQSSPNDGSPGLGWASSPEIRNAAGNLHGRDRARLMMSDRFISGDQGSFQALIALSSPGEQAKLQQMAPAEQRAYALLLRGELLKQGGAT